MAESRARRGLFQDAANSDGVDEDDNNLIIVDSDGDTSSGEQLMSSQEEIFSQDLLEGAFQQSAIEEESTGFPSPFDTRLELVSPESRFVSPLDKMIDDKKDPVMAMAFHFIAQKCMHRVSHNGAAALWDFMVYKDDLIQEAKKVWSATKGALKTDGTVLGLPSYRTVMRMAQAQIPPVSIEVVLRRSETGEFVTLSDLVAFPRKRYPKNEWKVVFELSKVKLSSILELHDKRSRDKCREIILGFDSIPIDKSGSTWDVVACKFKSCATVFPLLLLKRRTKGSTEIPPGASKYDWLTLLRLVLDQIRHCGCRLLFIVADAPVRAQLTGIKQHNGYYSCIYCKIQGAPHRALRSKRQTIYFSVTHRGHPPAARALNDHHETLRAIAKASSRTRQVDRKVAQGVVLKSPLLQVAGFNMFRQVPTEYMHSVCLGVVKRTFEAAFDCGTSVRPNFRIDDQASMERISRIMQYNVRVPSDFKRMPRELDVPNWKASEWRNLAIYYFPVVLADLMDQERPELHDIFALIAYIVRYYMLDSQNLPRRPLTPIMELQYLFQKRYELVFGPHNCTYNLHAFYHLREVRDLGPIQESSAFGMEDFYGMLKDLVKGKTMTSSIGKQAMEAALLRISVGHVCEKSLLPIKTYITPKTDDTLVYTEDLVSGDKYKFYEVREVKDNGHFGAVQLTVHSWQISLLRDADKDGTGKPTKTKRVDADDINIDFGDVGAFFQDSSAPRLPQVDLSPAVIKGKAIRIDNKIVAVPYGLLLEN